MKKLIENFFLNEKIILVVIIINAVVLFLQESGIDGPVLNTLDVTCTLIFLVEMIVKQICLGIKGYWSSGWNKLDGTLVILSIPSIISLFIPVELLNLSFLLILRVLRVFRFFRVVHAFPGFTQIMHNFCVALKQSYAVFLGLFILILTFAMIGCSLFKDAAPQFFATPLDAIYSTFRLFTGEGWNEIPDTISAAMGGFWGHVIRVYFCLLLLIGCVIGMSLLNSIFVDAMVSDNDDDVMKKLDQIQADLEALKK